MDILSRTKDIAHTFQNLDLGFANTHMLQVPNRAVDPMILRALVNAAREQKRVDIGYLSLNNPETDGRIIVPHTLACTPMRWHVRAYCENNGAYRDFVLSRFRGVPDVLVRSEHGVKDDKAWNADIELAIYPDPRLSELQKQVICHDYGMTDKHLPIRCKAALLQYVLQAFKLDPYKQEARAEAQQIVIGNYKEVKRWL